MGGIGLTMNLITGLLMGHHDWEDDHCHGNGRVPGYDETRIHVFDDFGTVCKVCDKTVCINIYSFYDTHPRPAVITIA